MDPEQIVLFVQGWQWIGKDSIIGAGSVVTKDIPEGVIAFGNPCRVQRKITQEDRLEYSKGLERE